MANRIEVTQLLSGPKYLAYHAYFQSDGFSGDIDSYVLIDPANEDMSGNSRFTIDDITWGFVGFQARIHFELLIEDTLIWVLAEGVNYVDFKKYTGFADRSSPNDATGRILISTFGFDTVGDEGALLMKVRTS
jgi:hypothetical protein